MKPSCRGAEEARPGRGALSAGQTGRAVVFCGAGRPLELREYPLPQVLPAGSLLVRTKMATVCGSDVQSWKGRRPFPAPAILGHEIVGSIVAMGAGADADAFGSPLAPGDRITWTLMATCGSCRFCRLKDLPQKCVRLFKYGHAGSDRPPHFTGGFAEYVYLRPGTCCFKVPGDLDDSEVAPLMCAAATIAAGYEAARLEPDDNVVVQGAGMLGLYAAAMARERGANRVIAIDVREDRLRLALDFGADFVLNAGRLGGEGTVSEALRLLDGAGADIVVEVCGNPAVVQQGVKMLRPGGRYALQGALFPGDRFEVDCHEVITRCLTLSGIHNYAGRHLGQALRFLQKSRARYPFRRVVGPRFPLTVEGVTQALQCLEQGGSLRPAVVP